MSRDYNLDMMQKILSNGKKQSDCQKRRDHSEVLMNLRSLFGIVAFEFNPGHVENWLAREVWDDVVDLVETDENTYELAEPS